MTEEEILEICRNNVDTFEEEFEITMETEINTENGFDSLAIMNIIVEIEEKYSLVLDDYIIKINEAKYVRDILIIINRALDIEVNISDMGGNNDSELTDADNGLKNIQNNEKEHLYKNDKKCSFFSIGEISKDGSIVKLENGGIGFSGIAVALFDYFDMVFKRFALSNQALEEKYPVLLSGETLKDTGYNKKYPNYSMYLKEDKAVLSPSACFHVYEKYRDAILEDKLCVTFLQSVFRNEGEESLNEFGRLKDYHVRETVFIGNEEYVNDSINRMIEQTSSFLRGLGLDGSIESASDTFVTPKMERYKLIQLHNKAKYEVRLSYDSDKRLSAGSFNRHGKAFSIPFNIGVSGVKDVMSGCVGYGIERWVLAFMSQYGCELRNMPKCVREYVEKYNN